MKRLEIEHSLNGSKYRLFRRSEKVALYKQYIDEVLVGYELFLIKVRPEEVIKGVKYSKREVFASNSDFGVTAKSLLRNTSEKEAIQRFEQFEEELKEVKDETDKRKF